MSKEVLLPLRLELVEDGCSDSHGVLVEVRDLDVWRDVRSVVLVDDSVSVLRKQRQSPEPKLLGRVQLSVVEIFIHGSEFIALHEHALDHVGLGIHVHHL